MVSQPLVPVWVHEAAVAVPPVVDKPTRVGGPIGPPQDPERLPLGHLKEPCVVGAILKELGPLTLHVP